MEVLVAGPWAEGLANFLLCCVLNISGPVYFAVLRMFGDLPIEASCLMRNVIYRRLMK